MDDINNDPLLGEVIMGKYLIIRKLGEGSFGKIYKGEYDNKNYALKLFVGMAEIDGYFDPTEKEIIDSLVK